MWILGAGCTCGNAPVGSEDSGNPDAGTYPDGGHPDAGPNPTPDAGPNLTSDAGEPGDAGPIECPATVPANGSSCTRLGAQCSWGTDPRWGCRTKAQCTGTGRTWQVDVPNCTSPGPSCPTTAPTTTNCIVAQAGLTCVYGGIAYTCADCSGHLCVVQSTWHQTTLASGCPDGVPNWGAACTGTGTCDYNRCANSYTDPNAFGSGVICTQDVWQQETGVACP